LLNSCKKLKKLQLKTLGLSGDALRGQADIYLHKRFVDVGLHYINEMLISIFAKPSHFLGKKRNENFHLV